MMKKRLVQAARDNDMCLLINRNNPQLTPRQEAFRDWLENKGLANSTIWNYLSGVGECSHYLCHIMGNHD